MEGFDQNRRIAISAGAREPDAASLISLRMPLPQVSVRFWLVCGLVGTLIIDEDGIYEPRHPNEGCCSA
ncbi:hypothetical protein NKH70_30315, partial [Mesorhizobium sp. M0991]